MRAITAFLVLEFKRFFCKRNIIMVSVLWMLAMVFVQMGTDDYKYRVYQREVFQKIEKEKVSKFINYTQYGTYGFRMYFLAHPTSILFNNSGVIQDMTSFVDSGERLNIYQSMKGKNLFAQKKFPFTDFSGIIFFFGTLLVLLYGFDTFTNRDYLMTPASMSDSRKIFFPLLVARIAMILLLILAFIASALAIITANGLTPPVNINLSWSMLLLFLVFIFFFIIGTILSTCKSRLMGASTLFTAWFILLFILPATAIYFFYKQADNLSSFYDIEMKKLTIFSAFEKMAIQKEGRYSTEKRNNPSVQALIEGYWKDDFQRIQALEKKLQEEIKSLTAKSQWLSIVIPTNFYLSTVTEISSCGFENFNDFNDYVLLKKRDFVRFYFNMKFYSNHEEVISFVKGDENIFEGTSRLPAPFAWGLLVMLLQIIGLTWWSYYRFKKAIYQPAKEELNQKLEKEMAFEKGQFDVYFEDNSLYTSIHYSAFSGHGSELVKNGFTGKITVDDRDIISQGPGKENSLVFICNPNEFPKDINAGDFINFYTRFLGVSSAAKKAIQYQYLTPADLHKPIGKLQAHQKGELLFKILDMKKGGIYLLGDVCKKMPNEFVVEFKRKMETLAAEGSLVLFMNTELDFHTYRSINSPLLFLKSKHWKAQVDNLESKLNER